MGTIIIRSLEGDLMHSSMPAPATAPTQVRARRLICGVLAALLMTAVLVPAAAVGSGRSLVLDTGHTDIITVGFSNDALTVNLREDVTGYHVTHAPEDVLLKVKKEAWFDIPEGWPGAPGGYLLQAVQDERLLWPGWDTFGLEGTGFTDVKIHITDVRGPAPILLFTDTLDGTGPASFFADGTYSLPNVMDVPLFSHVHAHWVFPEPGAYEMDVLVTGDLNGRSYATYAGPYRWEVEDKDGQSGSPTPTPTPTPTQTSEPTPTPTPTSTSTPSPTPTPRPTRTPTPTPVATTSHGVVGLSRGHTDVFHVAPSGSGIALRLREDITGQGVIRDPTRVRLLVTDQSRVRMPSGTPEAGRIVHLLPMTQDQSMLWPGWSTEALRGSRFSVTDIEITGVEGPGRVHLFSSALGGIRPVLTSGDTVLPGTIRVPSPAHVHANWVFSAPGTYRLHARARSGGAVSSPQTYTFHVGAAAIAAATSTVDTVDNRPASGFRPPTGAAVPELAPVKAGEAGAPSAGADGCTGAVGDGHFDLGVTSDKGGTELAVKDDSTAPASWRPLSEMVFHVGDAAQTTSTDALSFAAAAGSHVWVIDATQQAGVPWLGSNSQHPSLAALGHPSVRWDLLGVEGPGDVVHFLPGALGAGVGTRLFDTVGGPSSYVLPGNTHQHGVWLFTRPGRYAVNLRATPSGGAPATGVAHFIVGPCGSADSGLSGTGQDVRAAGPLPSTVAAGVGGTLTLSPWVVALFGLLFLSNLATTAAVLRRR